MPVSIVWAHATSVVLTAAWAAQNPDLQQLARKSENPIAPEVKVPVQENIQFGLGAYERTESLLKLEPVIPIPLPGDWSIVTRTIIPIEYSPNTSAATGGSTGLGDISTTFFVAPGHPAVLQWGVGPDFQLPTAIPSSLGSGKWSLGPSVALVLKPHPWVIGAIVSNIWSFAGSSSHSAVNQLSVEYFAHYNFFAGWTLSTAPTMTANWTAKPGDVWTIPVGGGIGKVFRAGSGAIHPVIQAYDYVRTPTNSPTWELRVEVTFVARE